MDIFERQEIAEQGVRNLMLVPQGRMMDVLGDDFDYEVLYPAKRNWIELEDVASSEDPRPTEDVALDSCSSWIIRRNFVDIAAMRLLSKADERYTNAVKQILKDLPECTTQEQIDRAVAVFGASVTSCINATGLQYETWPAEVNDAACNAVDHVNALFQEQQRKYAVWMEKQRRAAYLVRLEQHKKEMAIG